MKRDSRVIAYVLRGTDEIVGYFSVNGLVARKASNARVYESGFISKPDFDRAAALVVGPHPLDHLGNVEARTVYWEGAAP